MTHKSMEGDIKVTYLYRSRQKILIVLSDIFSYCSLIINKYKNFERMNEKWNHTLHEHYHEYDVLYSRVECKLA